MTFINVEEEVSSHGDSWEVKMNMQQLNRPWLLINTIR